MAASVFTQTKFQSCQHFVERSWQLGTLEIDIPPDFHEISAVDLYM
jgi:hypothetical protein